MKYIKGTIDLPLILSIKKPGNIKWYVDAEFSVHKYTRIHAGGFMAIVTGGSYVKPSEQKLNTKSSTEVDLVVVYGVLITRVPPNRKILVNDQVASGQNTSISDIILSLIV